MTETHPEPVSSSPTETVSPPPQLQNALLEQNAKSNTHLTEAQLKTLNEFKQQVHQKLSTLPSLSTNHQHHTESLAYCTDACLVRYLKARDWDMKKSLKLLLSSIEWRLKTQPENISASELTFEATSGKTYRRGFDRLGRPVIYITPSRENSTNYEKNLQLIVYTVERAIDSMENDVEKLVLIVDFNHFSTKVQPPLSVCKEMINIMSNHYPERLGACYIVDAPFIFNMLWKAIKPFINSATRAKVHFVTGAEEKEHVFSQIFDMSTLESRFGGTNDYEFKPEHWQLEVELDEKRRAHRTVNSTVSAVRGSMDSTMLSPSSVSEADVEVPSHIQAEVV